eukprot:scaffold212865_cov48-Prasinocladus_malaysianus.AAC.5
MAAETEGSSNGTTGHSKHSPPEHCGHTPATLQMPESKHNALGGVQGSPTTTILVTGVAMLPEASLHSNVIVNVFVVRIPSEPTGRLVYTDSRPTTLSTGARSTSSTHVAPEQQ